MKNTHKTLATLSLLIGLAACSPKTTPAASAEPEEYTGPKVSYASDISPLLERSCSPCHYPNNKGKKLPLDSYAAVKDHLAEMLERVQLPKDHIKFMPYEHKKQDLSMEEIEMLKNWARGGFLQ